jgi:outer membrane protein assembly factor BamA
MAMPAGSGPRAGRSDGREGLMRRLALLLLCLAACPRLAAQAISDITIDGLPAGLSAEEIAAALVEKKGAAYNKAQEPADRAGIVSTLQDAGYLDAEVKTSAGFIPGGVRLAFTVVPRNLYHIEAVKAPGLAKGDVQQILDELKVGADTACTHEVCQRLSAAIADKLALNVLFLGIERKLNANKREVTLIFSK